MASKTTNSCHRASINVALPIKWLELMQTRGSEACGERVLCGAHQSWLWAVCEGSVCLCLFASGAGLAGGRKREGIGRDRAASG